MSYEYAETLLIRRGISIESIADIVFQLQLKYYPHLTIEECVDSVKAVLQKREVQYTLFTGIALDELVEKNFFPSRCKPLWRQMNPCTEWTRHWPSGLRACMV